MALAVAEAAGRYGHVIFPGNIHAPALEVNFFFSSVFLPHGASRVRVRSTVGCWYWCLDVSRFEIFIPMGRREEGLA